MVDLAFDTCYGVCSVAIGQEGRVIAYQFEERVNMQSSRLLAMISACLQEAGLLGYQDIKRLIVTNGPGSFTGIRVGLAAALGLQAALAIPVLPVSTLTAVAQAQAAEKDEYVVQLDAGRGQVYQQTFTHGRACSEIIVRPAEGAQIKQLPDAKLLIKYAAGLQDIGENMLLAPLYVRAPAVSVAIHN